jgi:DnaJ-class molecular chaperone
VAEKDYYLVLGVPRTESASGIQQAFRDLSKRFHPDRVGTAGTPRFQQIAEAYGVLSDPEKRRQYNEALRRGARVAVPPEPEPLVDLRSHAPEPLRPEPISILRDFRRHGPSVAALHERFRRAFTGRRVPKSEHLEGLNVEIVLSPNEAATGGILAIEIPSFNPCSACGGSGSDWGFVCLDCNGEGIVERGHAVRVRLPASIRHGEVLEEPIRGLGIFNLYLRLHIRIARS